MKNLLYNSFLFLIVLVLCVNNIYAIDNYGSAGNKARFESRYIVDMPNAGLLAKGTYAPSIKFVDDGGILLDFTAAPFEFLNIGMSYTFFHIIGSGSIKAHQDFPGINLKARVVDEKLTLPAIVVGFNSQGTGAYYEGLDRYDQLHPGLYIAASKSFVWQLGELSAHVGTNYCVGTDKEYQGFNFYAGVEQAIGDYLSCIFELNPNFNDNDDISSKSKVKLNTALRASISNITFELQLRDLFTSTKNHGVNRFVGIEFINRF